MIAFLNGILFSKAPTEVVLDVQHVGYRVYISLQSYGSLPQPGEWVKLHTYQVFREDFQGLYGFTSTSELELFKLLISVSGIGPKVALSVLSSGPSDELISAIANGNLKWLTSLPGVGKKMAERLVVELKDKLVKLHLLDSTAALIPSVLPVHEDAVAALIALGFSRSQAEKNVATITKDSDKNISTETIIRLALRQNVK